jgi:hypothetical protein
MSTGDELPGLRRHELSVAALFQGMDRPARGGMTGHASPVHVPKQQRQVASGAAQPMRLCWVTQ